MLKQRVITALVLLAILLPAVFYPQPGAFGVVALVLIAAGAWEWARLNQYGSIPSVSVGVLCAAICAVSWYGGVLDIQLKMLWVIAGTAWVLLGAWVLRSGGGAWLRVPRVVRLLGGVLALWVAWLAVIQARMVGINFLFSVLVLVWIADIFAYFAGRTFGSRFFANKLAPSISPGKTWEGVCGGLIGVLVGAFVWRGIEGPDLAGQASLYGRLSLVSTFFMVLAVLFLASMSVVGDLAESLFKRSAGVKDSSNLLPGHGGVLDRVDALLPILPLSMMLVTL
jgi:phosphatidate cytidylyltransferase